VTETKPKRKIKITRT